MFRPTSPQRPLFSVEHRLDGVKRARIEKTWAHAYQTKALGLIDETRFAKYFGPDNGRPNKSIRLVVSVLLLKEVFDLTDEEALARLEWDLLWHHALDLLPEDAHTCQKTLHNTRARLVGRYLDREGYFADARSSEAPRRLSESAVDVYWLVKRFGEHRDVAAMASFALLVRLYEEQCVPPATDTPEKIELQEQPSSSSLQSPSDPDATYGHKGKGYEVQLAETCVEENPFEVVTAVSVNGANESDQKQVVPTLEQTERTCGAAPEVLHTDAGYGSGENLVAAKEHGTELLAPIGSKPSDKGLTLGDFELSATGEHVLRCPVGEAPRDYRISKNGKVRLAIFAAEQCSGCPLRGQCPTEKRGKTRVLRFTVTDVAVARRRVEQETPEFKEAHKIRSGIEATNSELKRCHGLGKLAVRRRPRVNLAVRFKALALNIKRYVAHLASVAAAATPAHACGC